MPRTRKSQLINEKRPSTDTNTEISMILELSDKDFKAASIKMLQTITSLLKQMKKLQGLKNKTPEVMPKFNWKL